MNLRIPLSRIDDPDQTPVGLIIVQATIENNCLVAPPRVVELLGQIAECRGLVPTVNDTTDQLLPIKLCDKCLNAPKFAIWNGYTPEGEPAWVEDPFGNADTQARLTMVELDAYIQITELMERLFPCQKSVSN